MHHDRRSVFAVLVLATFGLCALAVACSNDDPPAASDDKGNGGTQIAVVDGGTGSAAVIDAAADADAAGFDPGSCFGDVAVDAGDAGATCKGDCATYCADIASHYRVGVADTAIACIHALGTCGDLGSVRSCVDQAIEQACPVTTSPSYCMPLVTACDPNAGGEGSNVSERGCESYANALSTTGRDVYATCLDRQIEAGTCAAGVIDCATSIRE